MVATKPLCDLCNSPAKHKCSRCKVIAYCCADHQVKMWRFHRYLCGFDHLDFIRQPSFEVIEARLIRCAIEETMPFEERDENASQAQLDRWHKKDTEMVAIYNQFTEDKSEIGRNSFISHVRMNGYIQVNSDHYTFLDLGNRTLKVFYATAILWTSLYDPPFSVYDSSYVRQHFNFQCNMAIIDDCLTDTPNLEELNDLHSNLLNSFDRLHKLTKELGLKGIDTAGDYKLNTAHIQRKMKRINDTICLAKNNAQATIHSN